MSDEELLDLSKTWKRKWESFYPKIKDKQKEAEEYWLGKQFDDNYYLRGKHPLVDNLIFEALETFLPIATRQNPEPMVESDNTDEGASLAKKVQKMLVHLSDILKLRLKIKTATRFWALYYLGVAKVSWSLKHDNIAITALRPQKLILDADATIEEGEYTGEYIGEYKKGTIAGLKKRFPKKLDYLNSKIKKDGDGTEVGYIEWWTDEILFWEFEGEILDKRKNPHWNYPNQVPVMTTDEFGNEIPELDEDGKQLTELNYEGVYNHLPFPQKPYLFLSVFNLGKNPFDDTSLIEQNIPLQDLVNKRQRQIDKNVDTMNAGWVVSGDSGFTKAQASQAIDTLKKGGALFIPQGNPQVAVFRYVGTGLPSDVFTNLQDIRNELRGIFGVTGLSPQGTAQEQTVRGKIITRGQDVDRIGGGIADYIEQFVDSIYNWMVQMMVVYYTEKKSASVLGDEGAREYISLVNTDINKELTVSVKEGSLIPKDSLTQRNEAVDLWGANALDPITLYERLEFPNPRESAEKLITWMTNPAGLLSEQAQQAGQMGQAIAGNIEPTGVEVSPVEIGQVPTPTLTQ